MRMFDVVKTNRLTGTALEKKYGIIIYEPPKNKAFMTSMKDNSKKLKRLLVPHGILIGKVADFKDKGQRLRGSYDMKEVFEHAGFFLTDQIIYRYNHTTMDSPEAKEAKIVHSYFMIFKPKRT